ncbi:MAG: response regulator [Lachnospiraceae bacterium]|nr:response regulator [Lachnospiraceae bacterium]MCX4375894.1 response regulator [Lachnospiraceae bacterium]
MPKDTILIADDAELNREMIKFIFDEQYQIIEAEDGEQAIHYIRENKHSLCLIFLDLMMPNKSGLDVLKYMNLHDYIDYIPVIMITGEATDETEEKAYEFGASDVIYKPFAPNVVMRRAKNLMELFEHRIDVEKELVKRTNELIESREQLARSNEFLINALSTVVEFRSLESGEHIQRVKYFTKLFLKYIRKFYPKYGITKKKAELITNASALHDLGKIAISDSILLKPGKLTEEEFEEMKKHTLYGCEILEKFRQEDNEFYQYCYDICRYHHERYDGKGYPEGLAGDEIPIWAQIVSIVDVYDALVSERVYKAPYAVEVAARMIHDGECGIFSPEMLDCFELARAELFAVTENGLSFADAEGIH